MDQNELLKLLVLWAVTKLEPSKENLSEPLLQLLSTESLVLCFTRFYSANELHNNLGKFQNIGHFKVHNSSIGKSENRMTINSQIKSAPGAKTWDFRRRFQTINRRFFRRFAPKHQRFQTINRRFFSVPKHQRFGQEIGDFFGAKTLEISYQKSPEFANFRDPLQRVPPLEFEL